MIRKVLFRFSLIPLTFLISLALIIGTPWGTRMLVLGLDAGLPMLSIKHQAGALNQRLELRDFELTLDSVTVKLEQATIELQLACLLDRTICADSLNARGVVVDVPLKSDSDESETAAETTAPTDSPTPVDSDHYSGIALPFAISVNNADLTDVTVQVKQMSIATDRLTTDLTLDATRLWLGPTALENFSYRLPLDSDSSPKEATSATNDDDQGHNSGPLADLPEVDLPFAIDVESLTVNRGLVQTGSLEQQFNHLAFKGFWHHQRLQLTDFELDHQWAQLAGNAALTFSHGYPIDATVIGTFNQLPWAPFLAGIPVEAQLTNSLQQLQISAKTDGTLEAVIAGQLDLSQANLPFSGQLSATKLQWPVDQPAQFYGQDVVARFDGDIDRQRVQGNGTITINDYPATDVVVSGVHQLGTFTLQHFAAEGGIGAASGRGSVSINDGYHWDVGISAEHFDLSKLTETLALQLNGSAQSAGYFRSPDDWAVSIANSELHGQWQQYPITVSGSAEVDSQWRGHADNLVLGLNNSTLELDGGVSQQQWQLQGQLKVPELAQWLPQFEGIIDAELSVSGSATRPKIDINAAMPTLSYQQLQALDSKLTVHYQPFSGQQFDGQLSLEHLTQADQPLGQLKVRVNGDQHRQELHASLDGATTVNLGLGGNLYPEQQRWHGGLFYADLSHGDWQLALNHLADIQFDLTALEAIVGQHCWLARASKMCSRGPSLVGKRGAMAWDAEADLGRLLQPALPQRLSLDTELKGQVALNWTPEQAPALFAKLNGNDGQLQLERGLGLDNSVISWRKSATAVTLRQQQLNLDTQFEVDPEQHMKLNLELLTENDYPLNGNFNATNLNLAPFLAWVKQLTDGAMLLDGDLALGGTMATPTINGKVLLKEGNLSTVTNPTELSEIDATIDFKGNHAQFVGGSNVGEGLAGFSGNLFWQQGFAIDAKINGESLDLLYPPMVQVKSSPNLYLIWTPKLFSLTGNVNIDSGDLQVKALPKGAVQVSGDVVFIDIDASQQQQQVQRTTLDLQVHMNDQLEIDALGVAGRIGGDLTVRQLPTQPIQVFGSLALVDGKFDAYGQTLDINRGQVIFNGPAELPNLDIEATRTIDSEDLTVGVRLSGVPKAPKLTLFSDRGMEQQEILSYLIRGQGLNSDGQSSIWASAALSLGVGTTGGVVTAIGEELGFKNVKLDAEGDGDDTQVTVSGYIGDKLYVKYGVGVFGEGLSELTVRYYLAQRLWLETVSAISEESDETSLDIYYQFEIQ